MSRYLAAGAGFIVGAFLLCSESAFAHGHVQWSVTVGTPGYYYPPPPPAVVAYPQQPFIYGPPPSAFEPAPPVIYYYPPAPVYRVYPAVPYYPYGQGHRHGNGWYDDRRGHRHR